MSHLSDDCLLEILVCGTANNQEKEHLKSCSACRQRLGRDLSLMDSLRMELEHKAFLATSAPPTKLFLQDQPSNPQTSPTPVHPFSDPVTGEAIKADILNTLVTDSAYLELDTRSNPWLLRVLSASSLPLTIKLSSETSQKVVEIGEEPVVIPPGPWQTWELASTSGV